MTMTKWVARFGLAVVCLLGIGNSKPMPAAEQCSATIRKQLDAVTAESTPASVERLASLKPDQIKVVQACLKEQGCYDGNPKEVDGIVGPFTRAALYKLAYGQCAPVRQTPPCGTDQDIISWRLTKDDVASLIKAHSEDSSAQAADDNGQAQQSGQSQLHSPLPPAAPAASHGDTGAMPPTSAVQSSDPKNDANSDETLWSGALVSGVGFMQDLNYPTQQLFENALGFYTDQFVAGNRAAHESAKKEIASAAGEITAKACKAFSPDQAVPPWKPDWKANMVYSLSDPVYAFYPTGMLNGAVREPDQAVAQLHPAPIKVDFGVLGGIGWVGATFDQSTGVRLKPVLRQVDGGISRQIDMARRFRTSVDLVVYKSQSAGEWEELVAQNQNAIELAGQISREVTRRQSGFLDAIQYWALPNILTMPRTEWDGVTLAFVNFPFNDPRAVSFLVQLLKQIRSDLDAERQRKTVWSSEKENFDVNLVVPYQAFVTSDECSLSASHDLEISPSIIQLADLVPRDRSDDSVKGNSAAEMSTTVDHFIVFLPQPTSCTKKSLRGAIEAAFDRSQSNLESIKNDSKLSLAAWRFQMLRRVIFAISPATWKYQGPDYTSQGSQLYDDLVYAKDNFGGVAFSSLPSYGDLDAQPAAQKGGSGSQGGQSYVDRNVALGLAIHKVFQASGSPSLGDPIPYHPTPHPRLPYAVYVENFCGAWRRELALLVEILLGLLLVYAVVSYWVLEMRAFYDAHRWWFGGVLLSACVIVVLLCLFDRKLREIASYVYVGLSFVVLLAVWVTQYVRSSMERDLP